MMKRLLLTIGIIAGYVINCNATPQYQADRYFKNNDGLIDHISPLLSPKGSASVIQNITLDDRGELSKRTGYTVIQSTSVLGPSTNEVFGGGFHKAATGSDFFAVVVGTDVYRIGSSFSSYSKITGSVSLTNSASNLAQVTHLQDSAVFCNESDMPFYVSASGNATTISTNTFSTAATCATYGSYLITGNTTESAVAYPTRVRWSDINNINSFPALNYIDIEPGDGDKIVSIAAFGQSVYIFKKRSIYQMLITGLDGPDAFIIRPISRAAGAWAKNSVKVIPEVGITFLAQNTAYLLNTSGLTPIGDPIQRTFDTVQRSQWANAVGEVYPRRYQYWLSVSTAGSSNTETLVYDYVQNNWTTYGIGASMLAQSEDSTGQNVLISGDYNGVTYKQDNGTSDNPRGVSTNIAINYTTSNMFFDSPEITKEMKYLYVFYETSESTITVQASFDYQSTFEYSQTISIGQTGAQYDTAVYDTDIYPATQYSVTRIELNREAKSLALKFTESSMSTYKLIGWTVVYRPEDWKQ